MAFLVKAACKVSGVQVHASWWSRALPRSLTAHLMRDDRGLDVSKPKTYPGAPVELPLRLEPGPVPTAGCDVCLALEAQRREARTQGDFSRVSDLNVEIRYHAHGAGS